jgi:hypothetical protein
LGNKKEKLVTGLLLMDYLLIRLGRVGMTNEAEKQGFEVLIGHIPMSKIAHKKKEKQKDLWRL